MNDLVSRVGKPFLLLSLLPLFSACFITPQKFTVGSEAWLKMNPPLEGLDEIQRNQHKVLVGVLDSGIDYNSKALRPHLHLFAAPIKMGRPFGIGLDLLGQDYFPLYRVYDDAKHADFTDDFMGQLNHGTHVSGLVGLGNPQIGLIPVRVLPLPEDDQSIRECAIDKTHCQAEVMSRQTEWILKGLAFAIGKGARIINMSLGMPFDGFPPEMSEALVKKANALLTSKMNGLWKDVLMVVAAGNEGRILTQVTESIPATLDVQQMLVVGALKDKHTIADYSNNGRMVDVYVRGSDVMSTMPGNVRETMSGTSMASPLIAHLAAELVIIDPSLHARELRGLILNTADRETLPVDVDPDAPDAGPVVTHRVWVANFLRAKKTAQYLLTHADERARWTTPPFAHGHAPVNPR